MNRRNQSLLGIVLLILAMAWILSEPPAAHVHQHQLRSVAE